MMMNLNDMLGIGVAGNFTGHLEQAGEVDEFVNITTKEHSAPKGLFPFYLPNHKTSHLALFPLSDKINISPKCGSSMQAEPEVAMICELLYDGGLVVSITPTHFGAFNDCSIRKKGALKISDKKNWGESSKGISEALLKIDGNPWDMMGRYNIASFLLRDGVLHEYGIDSRVDGYSYFGEKLNSWILEHLNHQVDEGPLEHINELVCECDYPKKAIISIGATRYTEFGEKNYLEIGDELFVVLYPREKYSHTEIKNIALNKEFDSDCSWLCQKILSS